ncbi:hypothetical protein QYF61_001540 [Mycteria americana]|uniref:Uncharacterized protein n=1 Tax=Mycteria americana TaxID=33587 RepID=A0AAN7S1N0_MYCAM|nr:hypothetical protein QYF61_001540 [Mycteria americana]
MPSSYRGAEPIFISGVAGGSQQLTVLDAEVSLMENEWQKLPVVTGPEAPCILGIDYHRRGYFKGPKGSAALETEEIKQLSTLPGLLENPSVVGLLRAEEQQVPTATTTVCQQQYLTSQDSPIPIHKLIHRLENFNTNWCQRQPSSMPQLIPRVQATVCFHLEGHRGWKHSPTICHGLIQTALEQGEAPEHLQYTDDIILWGKRAEEVFEKGKKIVQNLLKAGFAVKPGIKWQDGHHQIPMDVVNKITAMSPPTSKKGNTSFLRRCGKAPGETRGRPSGFWSRGYRGSKARYTPTEKEILAAYEGVRAASEVVGTEAQFLLAPRLLVLCWMFKGRVPSTHHATDTMWSKWVALITQQARTGNPNCPGILEVIMDWPEDKDFRISPEEEVTHAEEAPLYNKLPENEKQYALFADGPCRIVGKHQRWKAAVRSPIQQVVETAKGDGEPSQFAEVKAIQLALDIAE